MEELRSDLRQALREIEHERELRETITQRLELALKLQAAETMRRLDELNHAHAAAMENWRTSLPRELFEQWKEEHQKWREGVNAALLSLTSMKETQTHLGGRLSVIEVMAQKFSGALILLAAMGVAGVIALLLGLARLAGLLP